MIENQALMIFTWRVYTIFNIDTKPKIQSFTRLISITYVSYIRQHNLNTRLTFVISPLLFLYSSYFRYDTYIRNILLNVLQSSYIRHIFVKYLSYRLYTYYMRLYSYCTRQIFVTISVSFFLIVVRVSQGLLKTNRLNSYTPLRISLYPYYKQK